VRNTDALHSYILGFGTVQVHAPTAAARDAKPASLPRTESTGSAQYPFTSSSTTGEGDEGRHRNHPLYSKSPEADGLYHCPFKSDPNCQHKPTKLKCNYE
jgi:hypothetical protein